MFLRSFYRASCAYCAYKKLNTAFVVRHRMNSHCQPAGWRPTTSSSAEQFRTMCMHTRYNNENNYDVYQLITRTWCNPHTWRANRIRILGLFKRSYIVVSWCCGVMGRNRRRRRRILEHSRNLFPDWRESRTVTASPLECTLRSATVRKKRRWMRGRRLDRTTSPSMLFLGLRAPPFFYPLSSLDDMKFLRRTESALGYTWSMQSPRYQGCFVRGTNNERQMGAPRPGPP